MIRKLGKSKINVPTLLFSLCVSLSLWKKFSQEYVFATLWPILKNVSYRKLNRYRKIVKVKQHLMDSKTTAKLTP